MRKTSFYLFFYIPIRQIKNGTVNVKRLTATNNMNTRSERNK